MASRKRHESVVRGCRREHTTGGAGGRAYRELGDNGCDREVSTMRRGNGTGERKLTERELRIGLLKNHWHLHL